MEVLESSLGFHFISVVLLVRIGHAKTIQHFRQNHRFYIKKKVPSPPPPIPSLPPPRPNSQALPEEIIKHSHWFPTVTCRMNFLGQNQLIPSLQFMEIVRDFM